MRDITWLVELVFALRGTIRCLFSNTPTMCVSFTWMFFRNHELIPHNTRNLGNTLTLWFCFTTSSNVRMSNRRYCLQQATRVVCYLNSWRINCGCLHCSLRTNAYCRHVERSHNDLTCVLLQWCVVIWLALCR